MFAVIYIPQFWLQAVLRPQPELWSKPVALVDPSARTPAICDMTEPARAAGVTVGLTPIQAMARCDHVLLRPRSPRQENATTTAILQCAYAFSPHLEATGPGICTLDLQGLAALAEAGSPRLERWARHLQQTLAKVGISAAVGVGPTPHVARHAARWGKGLAIVLEPEAFITALPVSALEPSPDIEPILKRWGIRTVGELLALGQDALSARLGLEALALFAAASNTATRPLHLIHPTERFEESFDFDPAVATLEPLLFLLRRFVDQLSQRLEPRGLVAETMVLQLSLESGQRLAARLRLPQPTRQANVLFRTLHTYLESLRTESAIQGVNLHIAPAREEQKQLGLFETTLADPHQFQETLARLSAVLGADRVGTPALDNSHRPDAFQLNAPDFENAPLPAEDRRVALTHVMPIRRFRPAIQAEVECESRLDMPAPGREHPPSSWPTPHHGNRLPARGPGRPAFIHCSVAQGRLGILVGPWRASGNWWEPDGWEREEWDAATSDGQVIRLVHQADGWFVEGVVD